MVNWENTFEEVEQARPEMALLPIGAIEQHSYHLPLGTDYFAAQALAERVARELGNCYLLPTLPVSCSREHCDFAGTLWLSPTTLAGVIQDLVESVRYHGIRKVVVLVAHGGNWIIKPLVRELNLDRRDVRVIFTTPEAFTVQQGEFPDLHAGQAETSLMLALRPDLVKRERMRPDFTPSQGREFLDYVGTRRVSPTGLWGAPSKGTAEEGEKILAEATKRTVEYIRKTFAELERLERGEG